MAHWVSEFKRVEVPQIVTEVCQVADCDSKNKCKVEVKHRHATTVSWNCKSHCNNNVCRPPPQSHFHRSTSKSYLYVQNREEVSQCIQDKGDDDCVQSVEIKNCRCKEKHCVEVKKLMNNPCSCSCRKSQCN